MNKKVPFSVLLGKVITHIDVLDNSLVVIDTSDDKRYQMFHEQDCCEDVYLEDACGNLDSLLNTQIILAEKVSNIDAEAQSERDESYTWTFYRLATIKGFLTLRWYGASNGFYSEEVELYEVPPRVCANCEYTDVIVGPSTNGLYFKWCEKSGLPRKQSILSKFEYIDGKLTETFPEKTPDFCPFKRTNP